MATIGTVGTVITGTTPSTSNSLYYASDDIPFFKPADISDSAVASICDSENHISAIARSKARIVPAGSILVTCIGTIGKTAITAVDCAFNQQINAVVVDKDRYDAGYIANAIWFAIGRARKTADAPVVPIINKTQFFQHRYTRPTH